MSALQCNSCGAIILGRDDVCAYCGSVSPRCQNIQSIESVLDMAAVDTKTNLLQQLELEIAFLEEQLLETGHPSIIKKISNLRAEIAKLE